MVRGGQGRKPQDVLDSATVIIFIACGVSGIAIGLALAGLIKWVCE